MPSKKKAKKPTRKPAAKKVTKKAKKVEAVPAKYGSVTPHMIVSPCNRALEFYKDAFGAKVLTTMPGPGGLIVHAEMKIGDSIVMLCDEIPQMQRYVSPQQLKGTTIALHMYVKDVDAAFKRAVDAGATVSMSVMDTFWGDRYGRVTDPWGHEWSLATHKQDLTHDEIAKGAQTFFANIGQGQKKSSDQST